MDASQLARISHSLIGKILEARAHARHRGIDNDFRVILQHAGEMRDLLIKALFEYPHLATGYMRAIARYTDRDIEQLAALAAMPDGEMQ